MLPLRKDAALRKMIGMDISDAGLQFIAGWEGSRNQLYDDGGPGVGNCTIGVGHLVHYGPCDGRLEEQPFLNGLIDDQIAALLRTDVQRFVGAVNRLMPGVNQNQFDALVDFAFNCGEGALSQVVGADVCAMMRRFVHDGAGNELDALVRRREAECALFNTPEGRMYTDADIDAKITNLLQAIAGNGAKVDAQEPRIANLEAIAWRDAVRINALEAAKPPAA